MAFSVNTMSFVPKPKYKYERIYEFVVEYVEQHGTYRNALREAGRIFYPDKEPREAVKRAWDLFRYALSKKTKTVFGTRYSEHSEHFSEQISDNLEHNMGYFVSNHSGPVHDNKFARDSKSNRRLFEFKKMVYAVLQDIVKPKSVLRGYVERMVGDPRVVGIVSEGGNIWYNGQRYIKLDKRRAALLYLVCYHIYARHFGIGNKPSKLIRKFFEITGYAPNDITDELRSMAGTFLDWLLFLSP